jgi:hypothetical protein
MSVSVGNLPYEAVTSAEKASARRLEGQGLVRIHRELDSREIYYVSPIVKSKVA